MAQRLAGAMSLLAFVFCLLIGGFQAQNPFATTVSRALAAMAVTYIVGLIIGAMAQKMLDENLATTSQKKQEISEANSAPSDR
jgi:uncharacterized membrane protein